ncbi:MAG: hypothetical protein LQ344_002961 [Seirophora lacunosa]|nr:MAG: hypothetical protein LQ344_002961 [Seirophora lacunosa]
MPPSTRKRAPETANDSQSPAKKPRTVKGKAAGPGKVVEADDDNKPINSPSQLTPGVKLPAKRSKGASLNKSLKPGDTDKPLEIAEKKVSTTRSIKKEETPEPDSENLASPRSKSNKRVRTETEETKAAIGVKSDTSPKKIPKKSKTKSHDDDEEEEEEAGDPASEGATPKKTKRKRKSKEEKEAEAMPLAARATGLRMFLGAHVSGAKGVQNAVTNCVHIGGNAFALFLKSQRKWDNPPLQDEHRDGFKANCVRHGYDATRHVLPHGSYLVNLAQENAEKAAQAYGSFVEDLRRCEALGITLYNFHPGTTNNQPRPAAIARIASALNRALSATTTVTPLLETMAGSGTVIGSTFADLAAIIALVDDKSRVGVCLDTCHLFAAGYDLRAPPAFAAVLRDFDATVGLRYVKALHLNDSKAPLGSRRDLHANIGTGFLGLRAFWNVMNERAFEGLPMVLETPIDRKVDDGAAKEDSGADDEEQNAQGKGGVKAKAKRKRQTNRKVDGTAGKDDLDAEDGEQNADVNDTAKAKGKKKGPVKPPKEKTVEDKSIWAREIKLLESLIGMDAESEEFKVLEKGLADQGAEERKKYQEAYDRKLAKEEKVKTKDIGSFFTKKMENGKADAVVVGDGSSLSELSELSDGFEK